MRKITFINANNDSIDISSVSTYKILSLSGIANNAPFPQQIRGFEQNGVSYLGSLLEPRVIDFATEINDYDETLLQERRFHIMKVFNPSLGLGELIFDNGYKVYRIDAFVYDFIEMLEPPYNTENLQAFNIGLCCPNPAWKSYEQYSRKLIGFIGGLQIPFQVPCILAEQGATVEIDYNGTLDAPLLIEFRGPATMPKIIKEETGEYIEINVELEDGEKLYIDTTRNDINVYTQDKAGIKHPAFNYIKPTSTYFGLTGGKNTISFSAASGDPEVYLNWHEQFSGA